MKIFVIGAVRGASAEWREHMEKHGARCGAPLTPGGGVHWLCSCCRNEDKSREAENSRHGPAKNTGGWAVREQRPECSACNHLPVCRDDLRQNIGGTCPHYAPEAESAVAALRGLLPRGEDDYYPDCATPEFRAAVELARSAV
jgi:hypothetical protein